MVAPIALARAPKSMSPPVNPKQGEMELDCTKDMDLGSVPIQLIDFQLEWPENGLELMAKGMRTQPTSRNSIPTSQNLDIFLFRWGS